MEFQLAQVEVFTQLDVSDNFQHVQLEEKAILCQKSRLLNSTRQHWTIFIRDRSACRTHRGIPLPSPVLPERRVAECLPPAVSGHGATARGRPVLSS